MAKDPAVLFYTSDFLSGTYGMTMDERGQYITLLCLQHLQGHLSEKTIRLSVGEISSDVRAKFVIDEQGLLFNPRMDEEKEKRAAFVTARVLNGQKGGRPPKSKESENLNETDRFSVGKAKENLAENENININDNSNTSRDREIAKREKDERKQLISSIVDYLNKKTGKRFRSDTQGTTKYISARLNEGYTYEDFIKVIDTKTCEWKNTDFEKFLCPDTLFNSEKFPKYLNQKGERANDDEDWLSQQWRSGCTNV